MGRGAAGGDEQEKSLDEAAQQFSNTLGGNDPVLPPLEIITYELDSEE